MSINIVPANVLELFEAYRIAAASHHKRMSQLELTPLERRFVADSTAVAAAAAVYTEHAIYNDHQFLQVTAMSATFCLAVMTGDSHIYDAYFDANDDLIVGHIDERGDDLRTKDGRYPLEYRQDICAKNYRSGAEN